MEIEQDGEFLTRHMQGYQYSLSGGTASPEYAQQVHRIIADEAIELLEAQGIYIEDLHDPSSIYRGDPSAFSSWPMTGSGDLQLPTASWSDPDYWTDADLASGAATLTLGTFTLIDGAHDADGVDIAFGYTFEDNFDSHFWIVDNYDDDGLNSFEFGSTNHHSALSKLRALFYGQDNGAPGDSQLVFGAIDHYTAGHKQAAWWFVGHGVHLIGDLSVPSHVNDENSHGFWGATYHDWMDRGGHTMWNHQDALSKGGMIDPYTSENEGDPIRYLAYTTAQLGNSFPYAETYAGSQDGAAGNRTAGGDPPYYETTMNSLFATINSRPTALWHVNKDEVDDFFAGCQLVDFVGPFETRADCAGGGDGHVDYDNTDDEGNDDDGDLTRIASDNYPYAIRAAAGLIYYFAIETGQISVVVTNTGDSGIGSLRDAIAISPPGNVITFDPSLSGATISLTSGQIEILKDLTIDALNLSEAVTIESTTADRVFEVADNQTVTMSGLTIAGGYSDLGGGIRNNFLSTLTITDSTISGNHATSQGGAIYNFAGTLTLLRVTLSNNSAGSAGGAIWAPGYVGMSTGIQNSTIQGNYAPNHGGIVNENGTLVINQSTITQNEATAIGGFGGGVSHLDFGGATTTLENTIVADNIAATGPDVYKNSGNVNGQASNLIGNNNSVETDFLPSATVGTAGAPLDPMLGALADNGGPTSTMRPLVGSPAVDRVFSAFIPVTIDQRGVSRPHGIQQDLGAVEVGLFTGADFSDGGASLQSGFAQQGTTDATYVFDAPGGLAVMTVDLPDTAQPIHTRNLDLVFSSGSEFITDGTFIGPLAQDHFLHIAPGARIDIRLSGLSAGTYRFEGWWSDVLQGPGLVYQRLDVSTDGGSSFTTYFTDIDPAGMNVSPIVAPFTADGVQDVVIRVTENNAFNQLRLNGFLVPEPGFLWQLLPGLGLLGMLGHRRGQPEVGGEGRTEK
jgi:hypothetical protein